MSQGVAIQQPLTTAALMKPPQVAIRPARQLLTGAAARVVDANSASARRKYNDKRSDSDSIVEIDCVLISHTDAA